MDMLQGIGHALAFALQGRRKKDLEMGGVDLPPGNRRGIGPALGLKDMHTHIKEKQQSRDYPHASFG